jgi:hypothetical protein
VDLDGDGISDILSGCYSRMDKAMAGLFYVMRGQADGTFKPPEVLKGTDGEPLIIPIKGEEQMTENICTRPFAVDWDGDGKLDLVVGNFSGTFYWFKGEGHGKFNPKPQQIMDSEGQPLKISGNHSDPFVVDINGDGALDILSGSTEGGVQWAENIAGKGKPPVLKPFRPLIKPGAKYKYLEPLEEKDVVGPTTATRIWVADVNGDGKLDILVGDDTTLISPAKGLTREEFDAKRTEWEAKIAEVSKEMNDEKADEKARNKAREKFQKLYEDREKFMIEDRTGFVWLYLQK